MKKYDIAVVVGVYTDNSGEQKNRYKNVGAVIQGENGPFIVMDKTFNPAGLVRDPDKDSVILSLFEPREKEDTPKPKKPNLDF